MKASTFDDFFWENAEIIVSHKEGDVWTNRHQRAHEDMISMGVDGDAVAQRIKSGEIDLTNLDAIQADSELGLFLDRQFQTGLGLWIDSAIPNLGATNRPQIYNNPHLRLALMYQGFISTFTATHLPKMWQRFKNQGPAMTFNVFSQVTTLAVMAYLAQALKDESLYDEEDNPFSEKQKIYRAIKKTGLIGTPERVLDWFFRACARYAITANVVT